MITIKEMSEMLGVSPTTVSNVIRGNTKEVSQQTVERVMKIVRECNYIPNMSARNLAQNSSKIIGVVMKYTAVEGKNVIQDPFNSELLGSIEYYIRKAGYFLMLYSSEKADEILQMAMTWNVDGLLILGLHANECQKLHQTINKPLVYIDSYFLTDDQKYVNVGLQDQEAAYAMTKYLIQQGHQKIAFLADNKVGVDEMRWKGYQQAMVEAGMSNDDSWFIQLEYGRNELQKSLAHVYERLSEFTALFFASDYYAMEGINYLCDRGVCIPDDISVVGFDNNIFGKNVRPKLTTVMQSPTEKGRIAVEKMMNLQKDIALTEYDIKLPYEIIIRDTVKKIR